MHFRNAFAGGRLKTKFTYVNVSAAVGWRLTCSSFVCSSTLECGCAGRQSKKRQKSDHETKKSSKKSKMTIEDIDEDDDDDDTDDEVCCLLKLKFHQIKRIGDCLKSDI